MDYQVQIVYNLGETGKEYIFPLVQSISDPVPAMKSVIIEGGRGSGSIVIGGGQRSIEIRIKGFLLADGYVNLTTKMDELREAITTEPAIITIQHWTGSTWQVDRVYNVRRIDEIEFEEDNLRTDAIEYTVRFLAIIYPE